MFDMSRYDLFHSGWVGSLNGVQQFVVLAGEIH
jgi:hypothetical protein